MGWGCAMADLSQAKTVSVLSDMAEAAQCLNVLGMLLEPTSTNVEPTDRAALAYCVRVLGQRMGWLSNVLALRVGGMAVGTTDAADWMAPALAGTDEVQP